MNQRIRHLIRNPFEVQLADVALLQDEIEKYPYFSTLRTLLLFAMKEYGHSSYLTELKKTSIYSPSRVALYHYLQKEQQLTEARPEESVPEEIISPEIAENETAEKPAQPEISTEIPVTATEPVVQKIKPDSEMSFSEWLNFPKKVTEPRKEIPTEKDIKYKLIDEFIEKSPRILPIEKGPNRETAVSKTNFTSGYPDLMTETLAQIYVNQKKYDKAVRAYKILSLKYPDKKDFFEDQIRKVENLGNS